MCENYGCQSTICCSNGMSEVPFLTLLKAERFKVKGLASGRTFLMRRSMEEGERERDYEREGVGYLCAQINLSVNNLLLLEEC